MKNSFFWSSKTLENKLGSIRTVLGNCLVQIDKKGSIWGLIIDLNDLQSYSKY